MGSGTSDGTGKWSNNVVSSINRQSIFYKHHQQHCIPVHEIISANRSDNCTCSLYNFSLAKVKIRKIYMKYTTSPLRTLALRRLENGNARLRLQRDKRTVLSKETDPSLCRLVDTAATPTNYQ